MVEVYVKNICPACDLVMNYLDSLKVEYVIRNIDKDTKYRDEVIAYGVQSVPLVVKDKKHFAVGYNTTDILSLLDK